MIALKKISVLFSASLSSIALFAQKPNIVIILADDMGYGDVSALNDESKVNTVHIDNLSKNGIRFTDGHSNSSVSTPTRYGLLTGRYAFRSPLKSSVLNGTSKPLIPTERTTMASMLSQQGYHTACIGKWHLGLDWQWKSKDEIDFSAPVKNGPTSLGFDYFYGIPASLDMAPYVYVENDRVENPTMTIIEEEKGKRFFRGGLASDDFSHQACLSHTTEKAIDYLKNRKGKKDPFFLYFPLTAPHTPILPSEDFQGKSITGYTDFVLMVDDVVGKIVATLKENGMYENTIVVFTSDNGCSPAADIDELIENGHLPNYIFRGAKSDLYDGGHRVPLIVSWGEKYKNVKEESTVCLVDFFATFAELTGYQLKDNEGEDSFSLMPLLTQKGEYNRKTVVHHSIYGDFSIRDGKWKLLLTPTSGGWSYPRTKKDDDVIKTLPQVQLYDIVNDISEKKNVQAEYPEVVERLTGEMQLLMENGRSTPGEKQANDAP